MDRTDRSASPSLDLWGDSRLTRRRFVQAGALMITLAACRNSSGESGVAGSGTPGATESGTRMVETSRGRVEVPADPKRVACLVGSADVDVLAFGIEPVYSSDFATGWTDLPASTEISNAIPPEVEAVAATSPDLMIGWDWLADEPSWKQLEKVAPAVTLPEEYPDAEYWREVFTILADFVNRKDEGAGLLADFDARLAALAGTVPSVDPVAVSLIGSYEPGTFDWYGHDREAPAFMQAAGIEFEGPEKTLFGVSLEKLDEITAPTLLVQAQDEKAVEEMRGSPIWPTLPAVRADQAIEVDSALWGGAGLLWANAVVDDLERLFFA